MANIFYICYLKSIKMQTDLKSQIAFIKNLMDKTPNPSENYTILNDIASSLVALKYMDFAAADKAEKEEETAQTAAKATLMRQIEDRAKNNIGIIEYVDGREAEKDLKAFLQIVTDDLKHYNVSSKYPIKKV